MLAIVAVAATLALGPQACRGEGSQGAKRSSDRPTLPKPLDIIEAQAEDVIDVVPAGQWERVAADVTAVVDAWRAYRPRAAGDGADQSLASRFDSALADLRASAAGKRADQTMQAANDLSAVTVELFALYDIGRPVDIGRLDVIGRQIAFDAGHGCRP